MSNRDIYKDEFGQYHEVEDEVETPLDGFEDDDQDLTEDDDELNGYFDSTEEDDYQDEDEAYANEHSTEFDIDED